MGPGITGIRQATASRRLVVREAVRHKDCWATPAFRQGLPRAVEMELTAIRRVVVGRARGTAGSLVGCELEAWRSDEGVGVNCRIDRPISGCGPLSFGQCRSLKAMVDLFLKERGDRANREALWWGDRRLSFDKACRRALFTLESETTRDAHQWVFSKADLDAFANRLAAHEAHLSRSTTFQELYDAVEAAFGLHKNGKPLLVYDVTLRLGYRLGLSPTAVYLHRGPAAGANALRAGLGRPRSRPVDDFPTSIRSRLTPAQTEDFLCLARAHLRGDLWD